MDFARNFVLPDYYFSDAIDRASQISSARGGAPRFVDCDNVNDHARPCGMDEEGWMGILLLGSPLFAPEIQVQSKIHKKNQSSDIRSIAPHHPLILILPQPTMID